MSNPIRVYWDACAWIAYINQEKAVQLKDGTVENRFGMCSDILKKANEGNIEIVTSAFTLAEVCKSNKIKESPADSLGRFFEQSYILIIPVDLSVGRRAQILQSIGLTNLKPPDAIHLASAQRANVSELHSFDKDILDKDGQVVSLSGEPMKICKPTQGEPLGGLFEERENDE